MGIRSLAMLAGLAIAAPAGAGGVVAPLAQLSLFAFEDAAGWLLEANAEGSLDLSSASLTPPGKTAIALDCGVAQLGIVECEYEPGAPAASLAALLVDFPAGAWQLTVNGTLQAEIRFYPDEPDGTVSVTSPADGTANVGTTPSVSYTHDCSNCNFVALEYELQQGGVVLEYLSEGNPPAASNTVPYADFEAPDGPKPGALTDGIYQLFASAITGSISDQTLASGTPDQQIFEYAVGAGRDLETTFTVPEASNAAASALAALLALAVRRMRWSSPP